MRNTDQVKCEPITKKQHSMSFVNRAMSSGKWFLLPVRMALTYAISARVISPTHPSPTPVPRRISQCCVISGWLLAGLLLMTVMALPPNSELSGTAQGFSPEAAVRVYITSLQETLPIERFQIISKQELRSAADIGLAFDRYIQHAQSYGASEDSIILLAPAEYQKEKEEALKAIPVGSFFMTVRYFLKPGAHLMRSPTGFVLTVVQGQTADVSLFVKKLPSGGFDALPDSLAIRSTVTSFVEVSAESDPLEISGAGSIHIGSWTVNIIGKCWPWESDHTIATFRYSTELNYTTPMIIGPSHKDTFTFNLSAGMEEKYRECGPSLADTVQLFSKNS